MSWKDLKGSISCAGFRSIIQRACVLLEHSLTFYSAFKFTVPSQKVALYCDLDYGGSGSGILCPSTFPVIMQPKTKWPHTSEMWKTSEITNISEIRYLPYSRNCIFGITFTFFHKDKFLCLCPLVLRFDGVILMDNLIVLMISVLCCYILLS